MPEQDESTLTAAALLGRLVDLESRLRDLPRQSPNLPSLEIWRQTEMLLTDYVVTTVKLVQLHPIALFASLPRRTAPPLDLASFSEGTRQALHAAVVATHWNTPPEHPDDFVPDYSPDEAELQVVFLLGRWWAVWRMLEEPEDVPPSQRWEVLRVESDPTAPYGVSFTGV
jgi:hypothetical protein